MPVQSSMQLRQKSTKQTRQPEFGLKAQDIVLQPIVHMGVRNGLHSTSNSTTDGMHAELCRTKLNINRKT